MLAARISDMHMCPQVTTAGPVPIPHVGGPILPLPMIVSVVIGMLPAATLGQMCMCVAPTPDSISKGSATVLIGNKPAARMLDSTAHGGMILIGCPTVMIGG